MSNKPSKKVNTHLEWIYAKGIYGDLLDTYRENPTLYYKLKREMLQEDKDLFAPIIRGVERKLKLIPQWRPNVDWRKQYPHGT